MKKILKTHNFIPFLLIAGICFMGSYYFNELSKSNQSMSNLVNQHQAQLEVQDAEIRSLEGKLNQLTVTPTPTTVIRRVTPTPKED